MLCSARCLQWHHARRYGHIYSRKKKTDTHTNRITSIQNIHNYCNWQFTNLWIFQYTLYYFKCSLYWTIMSDFQQACFFPSLIPWKTMIRILDKQIARVFFYIFFCFRLCTICLALHTWCAQWARVLKKPPKLKQIISINETALGRRFNVNETTTKIVCVCAK